MRYCRGHMSQGCVCRMSTAMWSHVTSIVVTCQHHCGHMSKALWSHVTRLWRCRVTERIGLRLVPQFMSDFSIIK